MSLPPAVEEANATTLTQAMSAASISSSPSPSSEPAELSSQRNDDDGELEDGEIREEDEEDDGRVKTVFDDAGRYNVKVS